MNEPGSVQTNRVYIALGSNIGDREAWLKQALGELSKLAGVRNMLCSNVYETEPVGYTDQEPFLNMAAALDVQMPIEILFRHMMAIEQRLGRTRDIHWGPRTIDLDLIMIGDLRQIIDQPELIVPHPRMLERAFVLIPLLDVLQRQHPDYEKLAHIAQQLPDQEGVKLWMTTASPDASERFAN